MHRRRCMCQARRQRPWIHVSAWQTPGSAPQTLEEQPPPHRSAHCILCSPATLASSSGAGALQVFGARHFGNSLILASVLRCLPRGGGAHARCELMYFASAICGVVHDRLDLQV